MTRSFALLFAAASLAVGACAVDDGALGTADFKLTGQSPSGTLYRLRHADLTIAGPGAMQVFHTEDAPDAPSISTQVPAGSYSLALAPAWSLERVNPDGTAVTVDATLLTPNPLPFDVSAGELTPVVLRFQAGADQVGMGDGNVDVSIGVDDPSSAPPMIITSAASLTVLEGSTAPVQVRLAARPAGNVTVAITTSSPAIAVTPAVLMFTPSNFDAPQVLTVTGVQDPDADPAFATIALSAAGAPTVMVAVQVIDDDVATPPSIVVDSTNLTMTEDSSAAVMVHLSSPPSGVVVVQIAASDPSVATAAPSSLVFLPSNWSVSQLVTVKGVHDADVINETTLLQLQSPGMTSVTIPVTVLDLDLEQIIVSQLSLDLVEGAAATVQVRLAFQPPANTVITLTTSDASRLALNPPALAFTAANWNTPQVVTVKALPDPDTVDNTMTVMLTAAGVSPVAITVKVHETP